MNKEGMQHIDFIDFFILMDAVKSAFYDETKNHNMQNDYKRERYAQMVLKLYCHCLSLFHLYKGTPEYNISSLLYKRTPESNCCDMNSIISITRNIYENYLSIHYLFYKRDEQDEQEFRFLAWELSGLTNMDKNAKATNTPNSADLQRILEKQEKMIKQCRSKIENNPYYKENPSLKKLIDQGRWREKPWSELAKAAGFNGTIHKIFYNILSSSVHSDSYSCVIVNISDPNRQKKFLTQFFCSILCILSNFIVQNNKNQNISGQWKIEIDKAIKNIMAKYINYLKEN